MKKLTLLSLMFIGQLLFASENLFQNGGFEEESDVAPQGCRLNFASPWVIYLNSGRKYASARLSAIVWKEKNHWNCNLFLMMKK